MNNQPVSKGRIVLTRFVSGCRGGGELDELLAAALLDELAVPVLDELLAAAAEELAPWEPLPEELDGDPPVVVDVVTPGLELPLPELVATLVPVPVEVGLGVPEELWVPQATARRVNATPTSHRLIVFVFICDPSKRSRRRSFAPDDSRRVARPPASSWHAPGAHRLCIGNTAFTQETTTKAWTAPAVFVSLEIDSEGCCGLRLRHARGRHPT